MRILFLNGRFPQVSQTFVLNQIDYALTAEYDVDIFCAKLVPGIEHDVISRHDLYRRFLYGLPVDGRNFGRLATAALRDPAGTLGSASGLLTKRVGPVETLASMQVRHAPDVIVANFGPNGIVGAALKQHFFPQAKLVTIFHGHDVSSYPKKHGWAPYRALAPMIDLPLSVARVWAEELRQNAGIAAEVHYLGIPLNALPSRTETGDRPFELLFVGRMVEKKGGEQLLRAVRGLVGAGRDVRTRLLGDGPLLADLKRLAESLGLSDRVAFDGVKRHDEVLAAMASADCLVAPSVTAANGDSEGIPVTIMEAMAVGLPVVSTFHAGIPELVENGVSGLLAPERDVMTLQRQVEALIASPEASRRMATAARRVIENRFDAAVQNARLFARLERLTSVAV
jgi:colanic acid/amylovoran biosynthesis glycosyltransferase